MYSALHFYVIIKSYADYSEEILHGFQSALKYNAKYIWPNSFIPRATRI